MAVIHEATLSPDKLELASTWLARLPWASGLTLTERIGGYRFDDPAGEVGVECLLFHATAADGRTVTLHLPLTYRGAPLEGAEDFLVGTTEHSALGTRWVYDGCADPVAVHVLLTAVLTGAEQEPLEYHRRSGAVEQREPTVFAKGSGSWKAGEVPPFDGVSIERDGAIAVVEAGGFELTVKRLLDGVPVAGEETLEVVWPHGQGVLVGVRRLPA